jgi:hypothetical protein
LTAPLAQRIGKVFVDGVVKDKGVLERRRNKGPKKPS